MNQNLLHEILIEHFKYPQNRKQLESPTFIAQSYNPSCGDRISIGGIITETVITDIGFQGSGCVISQATASMLSELCIGKSVSEVLSFTKDDILSLINISLGPTRLKCALLSLEVLQEGLTKGLV